MLKNIKALMASIIAGDVRVAAPILAWTVAPRLMSRADLALIRHGA